MLCPYCGTASSHERYCRQCGSALLKTQVSAIPVDKFIGYEAVTLEEQSSSERVADTWDQSIPINSSTDSVSLIGTTLDKKYYIESQLGVGGMGTVYRARRLSIGDMVAVKVLHRDKTVDTQSIERFRREAQTAARLKHPNFVNVYDFGVSRDGLVYQVMELAEGQSLREMIEEHGTLNEATAAEIIRQVCVGLDEAHKGGVIHRDIKPENILVETTPGGFHVKVLDFGIVALRGNAHGRLTQTGTVVGTPHYMSPEQCMGTELDGRSDIYSLGIVLFEMLTGDVPFDSPTPTAIVIQHVNQAPPQLRAKNPKISPAMEAVVLHAMDKRREARPRTAGELAGELIAAIKNGSNVRFSAPAPEKGKRQAVGGSNAGLRSQSGSKPVTTRSKKRPALVLIATLLLVPLAFGGAYSWYWQKNSTTQSAMKDATVNSNLQTSMVNDNLVAPDQNLQENKSAAQPEPSPLQVAAGQDNGDQGVEQLQKDKISNAGSNEPVINTGTAVKKNTLNKQSISNKRTVSTKPRQSRARVVHLHDRDDEKRYRDWDDDRRYRDRDDHERRYRDRDRYWPRRHWRGYWRWDH
jgi:eukaryotic-like serine/threonine-protein kinase